jgi:hypothetical protein
MLALVLGGLSPRDAFGIGIVLILIGCFLLANATLFHHPRELVSEHFGERRVKLASIRGTIFRRLQIHLGFFLLLAGFGLELYGHYRSPVAEESGGRFPFLWVGAIVVSVVALVLGGWWLSHALFLRYVQEHFRAHPPDLEGDFALARELGELFGIPTSGDDSVQSYLLRIRRRIDLGGPEREDERARAAGAEREPEERLA